MSKPRYKWWGYVKAIVRDYPNLVRQKLELHHTNITADYSGMPKGKGNLRTLESIAIRELPTNKQREYESVRRAIEETGHLENGIDRLKLIRLVFWDRSHTLVGAAQMIPCSKITAKRWHGDFIRTTAKYYGFLD